jgi:YjbE family integral membrane protein
MEFNSPQFWFALLQIIGVNIVLSCDNAIVIALAARPLPLRQRRLAVFWGSGIAVLMRIALTIVAIQLLTLPGLRLAGALALLWIAVQLQLQDDERRAHQTAGASTLAAIRIIFIADLIMSVDNVLGVAAAARGSLVLLIGGLALSIPLVIFASTLLINVMNRWPVIITLGAALLGWVAGEMAVSDAMDEVWIASNAAWLFTAVPLACALAVILLGKLLLARESRHSVQR